MATAFPDPLSTAHNPRPPRIAPSSGMVFERQESPAFLVLGLVSLVTAIALGAMAHVSHWAP